MRAVAVSSLAAMLLVGGCGGGSAPLSKDRMLVYRSAGGPVYLGLRNQYQESRQSTEPSDLSRYRLVILDGTSVSPTEIRSLGLIRSALSHGVSVVMVNASEEHQRALAESKVVPVMPKGASDATMITPLGPGMQYHLTNLRSLSIPTRTIRKEQDPAGTITGNHEEASLRLETTPERIQSFVDEVRVRLDEASRSNPVPPTPPSDYPASSWFQVRYSESLAPSLAPLQSATTTVDFYGYFDSGDTLPSKWFQWVVVATDSQINPQPPGFNNDTQRGFVQTQTQVTVQPDNSAGGNGLDLSIVDSQPTNVANSLSSSLQFTIGYRSGTNNTSWLWQQALTQSTGSFGGWDATSLSTGQINGTAHSFMQTTPFNGDGSNWGNAFYKVFVGKHIHPMNASSQSAMDLVSQTLYRTQLVSSDTVTIDIGTSVLFTYLSVKNYFFTSKPNIETIEGFINTSFNVNLGSLSGPQ